MCLRVKHFFGILKKNSTYMKYLYLLSQNFFSPRLTWFGAQIRCAQNQYTAVQADLKYLMAVDLFFLNSLFLKSKKGLPEKEYSLSSYNSLRQLVFSTRKCSFTEGAKYWMLLPLNDSLIARLSHIGSTTVPQFFYVFSSCPSQDGYWMSWASLQQLVGYIQRFLHGLALLYFHLSCIIKNKKKERN